LNILQSPDVKEMMQDQGIETFPGTPEQLASLLNEELIRWTNIVKKSGAKVD